MSLPWVPSLPSACSFRPRRPKDHPVHGHRIIPAQTECYAGLSPRRCSALTGPPSLPPPAQFVQFLPLLTSELWDLCDSTSAMLSLTLLNASDWTEFVCFPVRVIFYSCVPSSSYKCFVWLPEVLKSSFLRCLCLSLCHTVFTYPPSAVRWHSLHCPCSWDGLGREVGFSQPWQ